LGSAQQKKYRKEDVNLKQENAWAGMVCPKLQP